MVPVYDNNEKETHCGEDTGILKDRACGINSHQSVLKWESFPIPFETHNRSQTIRS